MDTDVMGGTADRWGSLWGARADDWAATEAQQVPTYEAAIEQVGIAPGDRVLDVGCGSGVFLRAAAERGARVAGVDASEALLTVARRRVPSADLRLADLQALPFADDAFDLVTGFNAFFFADDIVAALGEARRVARPGAAVVIQVWGRPERCDLTAVKPLTRPYMPPPPPTEAAAPPLWQAGVLEALATAAGLAPEVAFDRAWAYEYPDGDAVVRSLTSAAGIAARVPEGEESALRAALLDALAPCRSPDGGYRVGNEWHYLLARA